MSQKAEVIDRRRYYTETREDILSKPRRSCSDYGSAKVGHLQVENEKRVRREIANCNERRRMQSINAGFENLRVLLPPVQEGEKLSKATILQLTAKFINSLLMRVTALEHQIAVYRQAGLPSAAVLADITDEVALGCGRKRRADDDKNFDLGVKVGRRNTDNDPNFTDLDDGNTSGRSSECYDNHFVCSPTSGAQRISTMSSVSPTESTSSTAARLEHLVMAIEQIEGGAPGGACEKAGPIIEPESYDTHQSALYHKFRTSMETDLRPSFASPVPETTVLKPSICPFTEEFMLNSPAELATTGIPSDTCGEKSSLSVTVEEYPSVAKLLNRPIPHKYLHRPQVVVNNSR
uniref:Transcription factor AP-4 n=1 Tax=Schistocephalus solidus TaxID=70667 RepID=A0A0X3Q3I6_SCHSO